VPHQRQDDGERRAPLFGLALFGLDVLAVIVSGCALLVGYSGAWARRLARAAESATSSGLRKTPPHAPTGRLVTTRNIYTTRNAAREWIQRAVNAANSQFHWLTAVVRAVHNVVHGTLRYQE
jgi:hypothetical protein